MIKPKKLNNGMRVHLVPFSGTEASTVLVLTKVGSRYEEDNVLGGSHFIEHLMFKGTERRPNTIDISKTLDRYGANYNAYTGKDLTGYYVKIDAEKTNIAIDLLHDMMYHSLYDPKEIDKERGVIIEEIKMYEENPIMHLEDLLEIAMFKGSRLGKEIAGSPESIRNMKREDLIEYRDRYYVPSETVIVIAGKVPEDAMEQLEKTFGTVKEATKPASFIPFGEMPEQEKPKVEFQTKEVEQVQIGISFPGPGKRHDDVPALSILAKILGGAMSSRLFIEVRERRGLCYTIRASYETYEDVGMFMVRAGLDEKRLSEATKTIYEELEKVVSGGVTAEELEYAKDNIAGGLKLALENSSAQAEFVGQQELFLGEVRTVDERIAKFQEVTMADIQRVAGDVFNFKKIALAAIGPYESEEALLKHFPAIK
ncbi:hypothetical protein COY25_03310 [Candidatus Uhrbacteria bacterium CG_4_10_14_0_2_um_filter_41_7]|uniref:Peptidase M16 n=1 Tax=Candidatus Uhrbacteria bacterium CG_4_9_14_3_um_filter_41_35 TaxID=1975034 RepID=A0A2M7XD71_9BACT|nr:MAG: hypothetical protein COV92_04165 [Candidatus Uhrbacteria bacterium CG11_big_fil_rev_8_21_14_0_20_41_9]PIZ53588.1 MAG: hypothetical protein COY25_03310 [Candidatus Uhrbacteria bacterium CG_4_10_14_0_2_um_filter_41_7]PJA45819.1 MAG: hypothetical protein CO173_04585 [Candidatus Uhrbacteria bacterium CG_4_9_14_3_um_filter_41_35]